MYTHSNLEWIWMKTRKKWSNHSWELFMMWMFQYKSKICKVWAHKNVDKFFLLRDFCAMRLFLRIHYNLIWPVWKPIMYLNTNKKIKHFRGKKPDKAFGEHDHHQTLCILVFCFMKCDFDDLYNGSVMRPYYLNEERFLRLSHPLVLFEHCVHFSQIKYIFLNCHSLMPAFS